MRLPLLHPLTLLAGWNDSAQDAGRIPRLALSAPAAVVAIVVRLA